MRRLLPLSLLLACAAGPALAQSCPEPRFSVSDLKVGDGALDHGFISGPSLVDVDGDGDLDLMLTHGYDTSPGVKPTGPDRSMFYLNDGHGVFTRAEDSPLSKADLLASGSTWADVDGDGDKDVFIPTQAGRVDGFYRNLGGGRFERQELGEATQTKGSNFTASWVDIDGDGDLDLTAGGPTLEPGQPNLIYRNDAGRFVRVTGLSIENGKGNPGALLWADLDGDGDPDLVVANSDAQRLNDMEIAPYETPVVWRNDGQWRFTRIEQPALAGREHAANVLALGDVDNDGDLDLFSSGFGDKHVSDRKDRLYLNDGKGVFREITAFPGAFNPDIAGGAAFGDFDGDGDLDILSAGSDTPVRLYLNDGGGRFHLSDDAALKGRRKTHASVAAGDIDGDGDLDAVIADWGEKPGGEFATVVRNDGPMCGKPLAISLIAASGEVDPPNARVVLISRDGKGRPRRQTRESQAQTTFRGQGASPFLFAVPRDETPVAVEVRWPNGKVARVKIAKAQAKLSIRQ